MPSKPPFYKQETRYSCAVACLRMVLSQHGLELPEAELRDLCDCTPAFGTDAWLLVEAARQLGFPLTTKHNLQFPELVEFLSNDYFPIVFVNLGPLDGVDEQHALVVVAANEAVVLVYDPFYGERKLPNEAFRASWGAQRNLTILVAR
jgi:ABC-type bacteriocin/lantibiotic exporter with double-glycine peptidase domain